MISTEQLNRIQAVFPNFQRADNQTLIEFQQATFWANVPANKVVFDEGDRASALALVISGSVRVYKSGKNGRELTLYRFRTGDSCILSANAILNNQVFPATAVVEQHVEAVMIPDHVFRGWVERYPLWRKFVFGLLSLRLIDMLSLVDDVVFRRMDSRIAVYLLERCRKQNPISVTHQEIAVELGSSREVISRLLEGFSARGFINPARGQIEVLDHESLFSLTNL